MTTRNISSRVRSRSPPPWRQGQDGREGHGRKRDDFGTSHTRDGNRKGFAQQHARRNDAQADAEVRQWLSQEDVFVLRQAEKKARIRVREGRAKPIDRLAVFVSLMDDKQDLLDDEAENKEVDIPDPDAVIEQLSAGELQDLTQDMEHYLALEGRPQQQGYWKALKRLVGHQQQAYNTRGSRRGEQSIASDVEKLLGTKSLEQLEVLQKQVQEKLQSNEAIDEDYWERLLDNIGLFRARLQLRGVRQQVLNQRRDLVARDQIESAHRLQHQMASTNSVGGKAQQQDNMTVPNIDPSPMLRIRPEDRSLQVLDESKFLQRTADERAIIQRSGIKALSRNRANSGFSQSSLQKTNGGNGAQAAPIDPSQDELARTSNALFEREVARGVQEDEEVFASEENVTTKEQALWSSKHRPRKPRYFNRVQMGYDWNKYNQTHYDQDNPPPKVVQGYKFNVFYPDLIDKTRAPTYKIERENGRKRGQSFAPAGEEDTCLIRFTSGPPYEDIAFRIVDKEWDYSAKHERGFRSTFDKGVLQLHFQFKKIYYRK